jgi:hypothetical protein
MIVWRGWGILVVVLSFAPLLLVQVLGDAVLGQGYFGAHRWPKFVALVLAALLVWTFARILDSRPGRVVVDPETGERITLGGGDHLFFVPVRYWAVLLLLAGIGFGVLGPASPAAEASLAPSSEGRPDVAQPSPITALPQQVRTSLSVSSEDLSGRWGGTPGADGVREVVVIESQDADGFVGRSFFEDRSGTMLGGGHGTLSGTVGDGQITFTIERGGREFVWTGTRPDSGTLTGGFDGLSKNDVYRKE